MTERLPNLKTDAVCPRCASQRIQSGAAIDGKEGLHGSNRIPVDVRTAIDLDNYVCLDCGYIETYIGDRGILNRIARQWQRVTPNEESE